MSRKYAEFINPDDSRKQVPLYLAIDLLSSGDCKMVHRRPLTIKPFNPQHFNEERRFLSGRIVKGMTRGKSAAKLRGSFNGQQYTSSFTRCRPPRQHLSREARETRDYLNDQRKRDGFEGQRAVEEATAGRKAS